MEGQGAVTPREFDLWSEFKYVVYSFLDKERFNITTVWLVRYQNPK